MKDTERLNIPEEKLMPLLELDSIEKGRKIYRKNDQKKVFWQLTSFKVMGINNEAQVLICKDAQGKHTVIPFSHLPDYVVLKTT